MNKYQLLILAVPLLLLAGCANNNPADQQNSTNNFSQVQTDNSSKPGEPYSIGPSAPPSAKGPTAAPQPQAVTKDENIHLTLPLKTE